MNQLQSWLQYLIAHPRMAVGIAVGAVITYLVLNHRSRLARQADERFDQLREERGDVYRGLRQPPGR